MDSSTFCTLVIGLLLIGWGLYLIITGIMMPKELK